MSQQWKILKLVLVSKIAPVKYLPFAYNTFVVLKGIVRFLDNPGNLDEGYIEYCRKRAEEHCATTEYGLNGLIAKRDELRKKADEALKKSRYYSDRAADYDSILQAVRDIDIYPSERKPEEKKQTTPKKKIRR